MLGRAAHGAMPKMDMVIDRRAHSFSYHVMAAIALASSTRCHPARGVMDIIFIISFARASIGRHVRFSYHARAVCEESAYITVKRAVGRCWCRAFCEALRAL